MVAGMLEDCYTHHVLRHKTEPDWFRHVRMSHRANIRRSHAIKERDVLFVLGELPRAGIAYLTEDGAFTRNACDIFGLWRLQHVAQLGKLHDPVVTDAEANAYGQTFKHSRLAHSLDVRAIALLMCLNNGIKGGARHGLELAGLTHDARTPAYGDGMKALDPVFFNEDSNYPQLLNAPGWPSFRDRYWIDENRLVDTVQGRGVSGTLLDIADKLAYLSRDVAAYLARYAPGGPPSYPEGYEKIRRLVASRPSFFALWQTVQISGGDVVFTDPDWLGDVLLVRTLMFRHLYYHHGSRYLERMNSTILVQHILEKGIIRKDDLLRITDQQLDHLLSRYFGFEATPFFVGSDDFSPRVTANFATIEEARREEVRCLQEGASLTFIDPLSFENVSSHFLVMTRVGKAAPFEEAYPERAAELYAIAKSISSVRLYWLAVSREDLPPALREVSETLRSGILRRSDCA
jgi:hypothetical protein